MEGRRVTFRYQGKPTSNGNEGTGEKEIESEEDGHLQERGLTRGVKVKGRDVTSLEVKMGTINC